MHNLFLFINHLLNFFLPALFLAVVMALAARLGRGAEQVRTQSIWRNIKVNTLVGCGVCVGGLLFFGQDGKVGTYAALVVGIALAQWWLGRDSSL